MKNRLRVLCALCFTVAFILAGNYSKAQKTNKINYGVFPVKADIGSRLMAANNLGVDYVRETQLLSKWDGNKNSSIDYWNSRKKKVLLNINNDSTPSCFPTNLTAYKNSLQNFLNVYGKSIELAAIENEELNRYGDAVGELYHLGSMQDYINELTAAADICKKQGIPFTDGGLTTPVVSSLKHYYETNNKQDSVTWLVQQMGSVSNDSTVWKRTDSLLNAFKNIPVTYVNLHWYEPMKGMTRTTGVLQVLCNYITQQTGKKVITNETGVKTDSSFVTMLMKQWSSIHPEYCIFWDGIGSNSGQPLTSIHSDLLATGIAFRNAVAGANSCTTSITVSPADFVNACSGDNIIITASKGFSNYKWSNGDTSQTISVKATGNYSVISHQKNCISFSNSAAVFMNVLPQKPSVTSNPSTSLEVCQNKNVQLLASTALTHLWNTGEITKNIFVSNTGKYYVTVSDANGCKNTSDTIKVSYQNCNAPSHLTVNGIATNKATLNWDTVSCSSGYQIQYRLKGVLPWTTSQVVSRITSSRTIYGLTPVAVYQWRILTYCRYVPDTVTSEYINGPEFTILSSLNHLNSVTENLNTPQIKIFPVPAKNVATISLSRVTNGLKIILTDIYGKTLWQKENITENNIKLPVAGLASGTYIIIVQDKENNQTLRLIKE